MLQDNISYEQIRSKKVQEYGTEFKDWIWILVKQYKDRTHFLFELLQNAEDAKATDVRLTLRNDQLIIEHNGILFTKEDVISITKVAKSSKVGGDEGNIGRFGIGFKSVYAYASTPRIYSGKYSFEIRDFIYPYEIVPVQIESGYTRIEIPFNNGEIDPDKAFLEIRKALQEQIRTDTLLFLNNIAHLQIAVQGSSDVIDISKEDRERSGTGGSVQDVNILYIRNNKQIEDNYLLFTDCEKEAVCLAFKVDGRRIVAVRNTRIFTFFPTDKESHQSFYIHAPFDTTPARDNIMEDSERNAVFIQNLCEGMNMAFCWMRDNGYLSAEGLNAVYPIYQYPEDTIFHQIYDRAVRIIESGEKLIPTNRVGEFKNKNEILMPENMTIVDIFDDEDIQRLYMNHKLYWIAKEIARDNFQRFRDFLRRNFHFKIYTWKDVIGRLDGRFLMQKDEKWFERLFVAIRSFAVTGTKSLGSHEIDVSGIPFVRLRDGSQVCAFENEHPVVYINNPPDFPNKIHNAFIQNQAIRRFYTANLRISEFNVATIVTDTILPKYKDRDQITVSLKQLGENTKDLKLVKDAIQMSPELGERVKNAYIVTDGKAWYKPGELHVPSDFGKFKPEYQLVNGVYRLGFLASDYRFEPKLDEAFFTKIGCADSLRQISIGKTRYLDLVKEYVGTQARTDIAKRIFSKTYQEGLQWDNLYEGFPEVMFAIDRKKSLGLASFLNRRAGVLEIRGNIAGAQDQNFNGANVDSMQIYSAIGLLLTFIPWIYTKDGVKTTVTEIHRDDVDAEYEKVSKRLLDKLPFKEENKALQEMLRTIEGEAQRELIRELIANPDSLKQVSKAWQAKKLKDIKNKEKNKMTPQEVLAEASKKRGKGVASAQTDEIEAVSNPERRKKKLEEEFRESMDFKINVPKTTLKYTYQDQISNDEKAFLKIQYNGYCQICGTTIVKFDGGHHFQAINVMKTSSLENKYKAALDTGWNSLCLCPNCAAKYRYGVKDISEFYSQVQEKDVEAYSDETINIQISLQDQQEEIHYSPKHFLALKTAMEVFAKKQD